MDVLEPGGARRRVALRRGLTIVGGAKADVPVGGVDNDQLHVWDQPPKLVFVGFGEAPTASGARFEERTLASGDVVTWRGVRLEFGGLLAALIEEIELPAAPVATPGAASAGAASSGLAGADEQFWRRLKAGIAVEQGLAEGAVARRWQDAVMRSEFDPDAAAREILASVRGLDDQRLGERSARLQRDLIMAPLAASSRGATRKLRGAAQSMAAMVISQFVVLSVSLLLVLVAQFVARVRLGWSLDEFFDRLRNVFGS
jgi:hypothetical protein